MQMLGAIVREKHGQLSCAHKSGRLSLQVGIGVVRFRRLIDCNFTIPFSSTLHLGCINPLLVLVYCMIALEARFLEC